jgi:hypothetical protein
VALAIRFKTRGLHIRGLPNFNNSASALNLAVAVLGQFEILLIVWLELGTLDPGFRLGKLSAIKIFNEKARLTRSPSKRPFKKQSKPALLRELVGLALNITISCYIKASI